jgi:hypothetical protein
MRARKPSAALRRAAQVGPRALSRTHDGVRSEATREGLRGTGGAHKQSLRKPPDCHWSERLDRRKLRASEMDDERERGARLVLAVKAAVSGTSPTAASLPASKSMRERSSRAAGLTPGPAGSPLPWCRWAASSSVVERILRSCAAGIQRVMTHRAHTRRPSRAPCPSFCDDSASRRPDVAGCDRDRRGHDLPPRGLARGSRRWAIRWAKLCRIGPYQAQRRAPTVATIWADLQVFRDPIAPQTPCFTRERPVVRNHPRPSKGCD